MQALKSKSFNTLFGFLCTSYASLSRGIQVTSGIFNISKIQLVVYYQCCVLIG